MIVSLLKMATRFYQAQFLVCKQVEQHHKEIGELLLFLKILYTLPCSKQQFFLHHNVDEFKKIIETYIDDEVGVQKTSLGIRNQKCYAVKVI